MNKVNLQDLSKLTIEVFGFEVRVSTVLKVAGWSLVALATICVILSFVGASQWTKITGIAMALAGAIVATSILTA